MNKFFKRMTAIFLAVSTTAASILMPATGIYAAETAATTQNTQAAQTTQNSQNTQTTKKDLKQIKGPFLLPCIRKALPGTLSKSPE